MEKFTINAVHEDDLEGMMRGLGMWDAFKAGTLKCVCGVTITDDNLSAFKKIQGKVWPLHSVVCTESNASTTEGSAPNNIPV